MDRAKLLAALRANGYKGGDTLAEVEKFISDENMTLTGVDGRSIDVKSAFEVKAKKKVTISVSADGGEEVEVTGGKPEAAPSEDMPTEDAKTYDLKDARAKFAKATAEIQAPAVHANWDKSSYNRKIKSGKAVFESADEAAQFGAWARLAIMETKGIKDYGQKKADLDIVGKAGSTVVNTAGGVLVPTEFATTLLDLAETYGVARRVANVVPMSRDTYEGPRIASDFSFSHILENTQATATDPGLDQVMVTAKKVYYFGYVSNELLEDSAFNVGDVYAQIGARAFAYRQDLDYVLGDGTSTYGGHSGLASALPSGSYVAQGSSNTWSAQTTADFDNMIGRVENVPQGAQVGFICSRQYFYQVMRRLDHATSQFRELTDQARAFNADGVFLGFLVWFSQVMPTATATTQKCCYFGAFGAASILGQRREMTIATSDQNRFDYDQLAIRMTARYGINIHGDGRGSTYGPITCLKTS